MRERSKLFCPTHDEWVRIMIVTLRSLTKMVYNGSNKGVVYFWVVYSGNMGIWGDARAGRDMAVPSTINIGTSTNFERSFSWGPRTSTEKYEPLLQKRQRQLVDGIICGDA